MSSNYEPFLSATTRINEVEGELASLGAGLSSMKHTIERLQDASRLQREIARKNCAMGTVTTPATTGSSTPIAAAATTIPAPVPAWVWAAPAAVDDDIRERRFASAAATVAKVR